MKLLVEVEFKGLRPHDFNEGVLNSALVARGFGIKRVRVLDGVEVPAGDMVHETNELKKTLADKEAELKSLAGRLKVEKADLVAREAALLVEKKKKAKKA